MDKTAIDRQTLGAIIGVALGASGGFGLSRYVLGEKSPVMNAVTAGLGGAAGGGVGMVIGEASRDAKMQRELSKYIQAPKSWTSLLPLPFNSGVHPAVGLFTAPLAVAGAVQGAGKAGDILREMRTPPGGGPPTPPSNKVTKFIETVTNPTAGKPYISKGVEKMRNWTNLRNLFKKGGSGVPMAIISLVLDAPELLKAVRNKEVPVE